MSKLVNRVDNAITVAHTLCLLTPGMTIVVALAHYLDAPIAMTGPLFTLNLFAYLSYHSLEAARHELRERRREILNGHRKYEGL